MWEARFDSLLEQIEHVNAARDSDETHGRARGLYGVEQRVEQQLGLVFGKQVKLFHDEQQRLRVRVARAERPYEKLKAVRERAEHLLVDDVLQLQLLADLDQRWLVVVLETTFTDHNRLQAIYSNGRLRVWFTWKVDEKDLVHGGAHLVQAFPDQVGLAAAARSYHKRRVVLAVLDHAFEHVQQLFLGSFVYIQFFHFWIDLRESKLPIQFNA